MITLIGNLKGGTGKSTVAFNLALWIATRQNKQVVVYDLDPQATLSDAFGVRREEGHLPILLPKTDSLTLRQEPELVEVLMDIGMSNMTAMQHAIQAAQRIIIPISPSQADIWATQRFLKMIAEQRPLKDVELVVLLNRADTHHAVRESDEAAQAIMSLSDVKLLSTRLYLRTTYRRSFSEGLAVFEMEPRSKATVEVEALGRELYPAPLI